MEVKAWIITGRVQGVGFRYFVRGEALRLGLQGYVENLNSGQVRVVAQGQNSAIKSLCTILHHGPPGSRVDQVDDISLSNQEIFSDFIIRR